MGILPAWAVAEADRVALVLVAEAFVEVAARVPPFGFYGKFRPAVECNGYTWASPT